MLGSILKPSVLPTLGLSITKMQRYKKKQIKMLDRIMLVLVLTSQSLPSLAPQSQTCQKNKLGSLEKSKITFVWKAAWCFKSYFGRDWFDKMFCNCHVCLFLERCEKRGKLLRRRQNLSNVPTPKFPNTSIHEQDTNFHMDVKITIKRISMWYFVLTMTVHIEDLSSGLWASVIPPSLWGVPIHLSAGIQQLSLFSPP